MSEPLRRDDLTEAAAISAKAERVRMGEEIHGCEF